MRRMIFFWSSDEWLEVGLAWIVASPDLDVVDEVRVDVGVVEFLHDVDVDELVGVPEALDEEVEFSDDVGDGAVVLEVFLDLESQQPCLVDLFEHHVADGEVDVVGGFRIEDSVAGFLGVWDEVVVVEVADEVVEF